MSGRAKSFSGTLLNDPESAEDGRSKSPNSNQTAISLRTVRVVASYESFVEEARSVITNEMENMVLSGLTTLVGFFFRVS